MITAENTIKVDIFKASRVVCTIASYRSLTERIYPQIGHYKLRDLRVDHLNSLYTELAKTTVKSTLAKSRISLPALL